MKKLYFVNNVFNDDESHVELFKVEVENTKGGTEDSIPVNIVIVPREGDIGLTEGQFVVEDNDGHYDKGGSEPEAKSLVLQNNKLRSKIYKKYVTSNNTEFRTGVSNVYSYHINIGHGNCSVIVFSREGQFKIWMIDCSIWDYTNRINYAGNLEACFQHIKTKFNLQDIELDKFLLTHTHYDHFNGINYLLNHQHINNNTEVWINTYYSWPDEKYNKLLDRLSNLNVRYIEPKTSNSTDQIDILYPNNTIVRKSPKISLQQYSIVPKNKVNNSSVVYKINLGNKSMIFPGDIETEGWNNINTCAHYLRDTNYYCVSHHGSINGHIRNRCPGGKTILDIGECCINMQKCILMGRHGAYSGIFSNQVLNCFRNKLYRTDIDSEGKIPHFMELDWQNAQVNYY